MKYNIRALRKQVSDIKDKSISLNFCIVLASITNKAVMKDNNNNKQGVFYLELPNNLTYHT